MSNQEIVNTMIYKLTPEECRLLALFCSNECELLLKSAETLQYADLKLAVKDKDEISRLTIERELNTMGALASCISRCWASAHNSSLMEYKPTLAAIYATYWHTLSTIIHKFDEEEGVTTREIQINFIYALLDKREKNNGN